MILFICDNAEVLSVLRYVKLLITIIKIAVPILLIISLMISYMNAVKDNDADALNKTNKAAVSKIIAAVLVFLIPTFVNIIANNASFDSDNYMNCIRNATREGITVARVNVASGKIEALKTNLSNTAYVDARNSINQISDPATKNKLLKELEQYEKYIEIQNLFNKTVKTKNDKTKLSDLISKLDDSDPYKKIFEDKMKEMGIGRPLNIEKGIYEFYYEGLKYFVYIPSNATTDLPILLWLHGDNYREQWAKNFKVPETAEKAGYPIIAVLPFVGPGMGTQVKGWYEGGLLSKVKGIVDEACDRYQCDKTNINIGGHSRGAIGTWMMVSQYPNFFHAASPVSCCSFYGMKGESFTGMKVWAFRGSGAGEGYNNDDNYACMQGDVDKVKKYAKEVKYTILPHTTHGEATNELQQSKEYVEFMFGN